MNIILAIDDKRDNLVTITALLGNLIPDCRVITALSGPEGIEMARTEHPDTIVLDVKMPGMDGFEVCRVLKEDPATRHVPVILLTAIKTDVESRIRGLQIGADAFLTKPIDETELIAQINVMLRIKHAEDLLRREKDLLEEMVLERTAALAETGARLQKERDFIKSLDDASPAYYVALSPEGRVMMMNRSLLSALGITLDEARGRDFAADFVPPDDRGVFRGVFESLRNFEHLSPREGAIGLSGADSITVEWHGRAFAGIDGALEFVFFVGTDITERRRLEKILMTDNERERNRIGQDLHDGLGQHLAGIAFKSEILRLKLREHGSDDTADVEEIARLVAQAINQTRDLARGLCPVDLAGGGLQGALEELKTQVESSFGITCLLEFEGNSGGIGEIEASNLYYIVREAVNNAAKHGRARHVIISHRAEGQTLTLRITDDGVGMPENLDEVPGMGLKIMKYRAWLIGAGIAISRNEGGGAVITCVLKQAAGVALLEDHIRKSVLNREGAERTGILVVDDHPVVRQGLSQIINREPDLTVCGEARNADEALKLLGRLNPRLAIVDLSLEGASGLDLIKAIRARYPGLPCLVLSIHDETLYAERAIRAGARGYVMKQEAPQSVVTAIRTVLGGRQYLSERVRESIFERLSADDPGVVSVTVESLSDREYEIFQLIGHGQSNKHIADRLAISVKTVENFRERIKAKLGMETSTDLVRFAVEWVITREKG